MNDTLSFSSLNRKEGAHHSLELADDLSTIFNEDVRLDTVTNEPMIEKQYLQ